jgi:hypothetical protein
LTLGCHEPSVPVNASVPDPWRIQLIADLTAWPCPVTLTAMRRGKRDRVVKVLASPAESRSWLDAAISVDRSLSAWIRDLCNAEIRTRSSEKTRRPAKNPHVA